MENIRKEIISQKVIANYIHQEQNNNSIQNNKLFITKKRCSILMQENSYKLQRINGQGNKLDNNNKLIFAL